MSGCSNHRVLACTGIALSGLTALASLLDPGYHTLALWISLALISTSTLLLLLDRLSVTTVTVLTLLLSVTTAKLLGSPLMLLAPLALVATVAMATSRLDVLLSGASSTIALFTPLLDYRVTIATYVVLQAILALDTTRRLHSLVLLAALAVIPFGLTQALTAALLTTSLVLVAGGFIARIGCPFKVDSRLAFWGSVVGSLGVLAITWGGWTHLTSGLWILGFILVLSGALVPAKTIGYR